MSYLGWFDDNAKKTNEVKVLEGVTAYINRFKEAPQTVITSEAQVVALDTFQVNVDDMCIEVRAGAIRIYSESYIQKNNFWIGHKDMP